MVVYNKKPYLAEQKNVSPNRFTWSVTKYIKNIENKKTKKTCTELAVNNVLRSPKNFCDCKYCFYAPPSH